MAATFRFVFTDFQNHLIDQLPVQSATPVWGVSTPGTFSGTLALGDGLQGPRVRAATQPLRTKVFLERDGSLIWGGQVTEPRSYDSTSRVVTINAQETTGYLASVFLPTLALLGQDQVAIAEQVVAAAQAQFGANAGLTVTPLTGMSGVITDGNYSQYDFTAALQAVTDLTEASGGFEFATRVSWTNGSPFEEMLIAYPQLGRRRTASPLVIEYNKSGAGNCQSYTWPDGPGLATQVWGSATTADGTQLVASAQNTDLLRSGYPLIESKVDFSTVKPATTAALQAYVNQQAAYADGEVTAAQFTVTPSDEFHLGLFTVGDDVRVRITDDWFPADKETGTPGFDDWMRIGQLQMVADQNGQEVYQVTTLNYTASVTS